MSSHALIAVLVIAFCFPFLFLLGLVSSTSGASVCILSNALGIMLLSILLTLMIFEIKRIADLPPDGH